MQVVEFKTRDGDVVTCCAEQVHLVSRPSGLEGREPTHWYWVDLKSAIYFIDEPVWRSLREQMKGGSA